MATPLSKLQANVNKILEEYAEDVTENVKELSMKFSKKGAQAVKESAKQSFNGKRYASGWTSQYEESRLSAQGIIYNKTLPGLPHLLENGHAKRGGGRVSGRAHIKPVEDEITKAYEKAVKKSI